MTEQKDSDIWVVVTGAGGFIGSHVTKHLLLEGYRVAAVEVNDASLAALPEHPDLVKLNMPVTRRDGIIDLVKSFDPDVIVHAAAYTASDDMNKLSPVNITGTQNVIAAAEECSSRIITFDYPDGYAMRPSNEPIDPSEPLTSHRKNRTTCEVVAQTYLKDSELDYVTFRFPEAYGPGGVWGEVPHLFHNMNDDIRSSIVPGHRRYYPFVGDIARFVGLAVAGRGNQQEGEHVYHVVPEQMHATKTVFRLIAQAMGKSNEKFLDGGRTNGDVPEVRLDNSVTMQRFSPTLERPFRFTSLKRGIGITIQAYQQNPPPRMVL